MQFLQRFLFTFALAAHCADGLTIVRQVLPIKQMTRELASSNSSMLTLQSSPKTEMLAKESNSGEDLSEPVHGDPVLLRPSAGKGPDKVKFALRVKNFYGTDLKHHTFSADMVMTIRWHDPRVIGLIPEGLDKISMAWKQALELVWMPGVVVSNRDIEKYEIIAASVTIYRSGEVRRVERANARVMKKYQLSDYPFDTQELSVVIASSKYMSDEVVLLPDLDASGVEENIWGLYQMKHWDAGAYTTHDGELEKSRGYLSITVKRSLEKYSQDHLQPAFIVLMISWSVFYFPFANPFIMARLALSILALLTFTNLTVKSTKALPGAAEYNWNDLFNQQIQSLMFLTIVGNVFSEILMHQFFEEELARAVNHRAKIIVPVLSVVNLIIILSAGQWKWLSLKNATYITQMGMYLFGAWFVGYEAWKLLGAHKLDFTRDLVEEKKHEQEKNDDAGDGGDDGDVGM